MAKHVTRNEANQAIKRLWAKIPAHQGLGADFNTVVTRLEQLEAEQDMEFEN